MYDEVSKSVVNMELLVLTTDELLTVTWGWKKESKRVSVSGVAHYIINSSTEG